MCPAEKDNAANRLEQSNSQGEDVQSNNSLILLGIEGTSIFDIYTHADSHTNRRKFVPVCGCQVRFISPFEDNTKLTK